MVVITGTDTGIGKTWVGCNIAASLVASGVAAKAIKLVETGTSDDTSPDEDGVLLASASGQKNPAMALRRYKTAVASAAAAELEGVPFDLEKAMDEALEFAAEADISLLEGAGGLMAPLTWGVSLLDVVGAHQLPTLVVAADRLGTLNHTLLTLKALEQQHTPVLGVVINRLPDADVNDESVGSNAAALRRVRPATMLVETADASWTKTVLGWLRA